MKNTLLVLLCIISFSGIAQTKIDSTTTYYLIRHAEKDRSDKTNKNPNLIQEGIFRAAKWSYVLENVKFDAIYSTDYNRTKQTAAPTAEKQDLEVILYNPRDIDYMAFIESTKGKNVLIVGHSNTTPMFVNNLLGEDKYDQIKDDNNANLYIVTFSASGEKNATLIVVD